jgi:hypothetical protein
LRVGYRARSVLRKRHYSLVADKDPCAVDTQPLSEMLQRYIADWERERPRKRQVTGGTFAADGGRVDLGTVPLGAINWLAQETRLPYSTISRIAAGGRRTTELRVADALVSAIGRPDAFYCELTVRPNPMAPADVRSRCCSGSLTGVPRPR